MGVGVLGLRIIVGGAVKEGKGGDVAIRPGRKTRRRKCWLTLSFNQSRRMSIDLDFFGRTEEVARPIAHSLSTNRRGGDC